jgi:two-component system chemotaxis sensor kinase CheA
MTDARRARYVALFASEARTLLSSARRALARWQDDPADRSSADEIFRALHTIKGMSASLDFDATTALVHQAESALTFARDRDAIVSTAWLRQLGGTLDDIAAACEAATGAGGDATPGARPASARAPRIVRVDLDRLDALLADLGGLLTARQELERRAAADPFSPTSRAALQMARRLDRLQERILDVRLAPLTEVFERVPPIVGDVARQLGKQVTVELDGEHLEVDRAVLDQLADPLLHLLRNAVDHGIESPDLRRAAGKRPDGRVTVRARREGDVVLVEIADDGRGIDRDAVAARARAMGILEADASLTDDGLLAVLERPGFTTARQVTDVSGRGVGLDVVVARLREIGASLTLTTVPGRGTVFSIRLPTRLGIVRALILGIADERYVMPLTHVVELVPSDSALIEQRDGRAVLVVRDEPLPIVDLRRLLAYRGDAAPARRPAVVVEANGQRVALLADAVHGQIDAVVQAVDRPTGMARWITGATVLADGAPALMVDLASVV